MCKWRVLRELAVYFKKRGTKVVRKKRKISICFISIFFFPFFCFVLRLPCEFVYRQAKERGERNWKMKTCIISQRFSVHEYPSLFFFSFHYIVWQIHLLREYKKKAYKRDVIFLVFFFLDCREIVFSFYNRTSVTRISVRRKFSSFPSVPLWKPSKSI